MVTLNDVSQVSIYFVTNTGLLMINFNDMGLQRFQSAFVVVKHFSNQVLVRVELFYLSEVVGDKWKFLDQGLVILDCQITITLVPFSHVIHKLEKSVWVKIKL